MYEGRLKGSLDDGVISAVDFFYKHCKNDGKSVLTERRTILKNKTSKSYLKENLGQSMNCSTEPYKETRNKSFTAR